VASTPAAYPAGASSPRTFLVNQLNWGGNTWDHHWEFSRILGTVAARIPTSQQTGFALDYQWNLNPNDYHADGSSKAPDWIAGVAIKTTTNRSGVAISPYTTRNVLDYINAHPGTRGIDPRALAALNPSELNQAEAETRDCLSGCDPTTDSSCRCYNYFSPQDTSSNGTLGQGTDQPFGLVDLSVGEYYWAANQWQACSWSNDWALPKMGYQFSHNTILDWSKAPYNGTATASNGAYLTSTPYRVAANLGYNQGFRCPTWNLCQQNGNTVSHRAIALPYSYSGSFVLGGYYDLNIWGPATNCPGLPGNILCKQLFCGQVASVGAFDSLTHDWWSCTGSNCHTSGSNWQLTCQGQYKCPFQVTDQDLYIVATDALGSSQISGPPYDLSWFVSNAGL